MANDFYIKIENHLRERNNKVQQHYGFADGKMQFKYFAGDEYDAMDFKPHTGYRLEPSNSYRRVYTYNKINGGNTVETLLGICAHKLIKLNE